MNAPAKPRAATPAPSKIATLRTIMAGACLDGLWLSLGGMMPSGQVDGAEERRTAERRLLSAASGFAVSLSDLPGLQHYELRLIRTSPEERLRNSALQVAGVGVVAAVAGLELKQLSCFPPYPNGEIEWMGRTAEAADADSRMDAARRAELRPVAERLTAAMVGAGWAPALATGQPPCDARLYLDRAAALARTFAAEDEEHASFAAAHHRASVVLSHGASATKALADLLITSNAVSGNIVTGIVTSEIGLKMHTLRSGLFAG